MAHKSGYLLNIQVKSHNYNSMETGMATIIHMTNKALEGACSMIVDKRSEKILGISSSYVSFLGFEQKLFEDELLVKDFFLFSLPQLIDICEGKREGCLWNIVDLVQARYLQEMTDDKPRQYNLKYEVYGNCQGIILSNVPPPF